MAPPLPRAYLEFAGEVATKTWADWRCEFELFLDGKICDQERSVALRILDLVNPTPFQEAALAALVITEKDKLRDLFSCLGSEGLRRFQTESSWNINHLDDPNNPRTLDHALRICDDIFGDKVHPMDSDGPEKVSHIAGKGPGRTNLVGKQRSPSATCDKREKEDNQDVDPSRPSTSRDKKYSSCGIPGHQTGSCRKAAQRPSRDSQTARLSTVREHHPSADAAHDDGRIRCSISLQPTPTFLFGSGVRTLSKCKFGPVPAKKSQP